METKAALDAIEDICRVDGIDGIFVGAADLAADMGFLGRPGTPEVQHAVGEALRRIRAAGKPAGILSSDSRLAKEQIAAGASFAALSSDVGLLVRGGSELLRAFRGPRGATDIY